MSVTVLLVDDQRAVREGLSEVIAKAPGLAVVGEAADGAAACRAALALKPDIVVMDVSMPVMNGIEATRRITASLPETKVLCLSSYDDDQFVLAAAEAGADGYLVKDCAGADLVNAIRNITGGGGAGGTGSGDFRGGAAPPP